MKLLPASLMALAAVLLPAFLHAADPVTNTLSQYDFPDAHKEAQRLPRLHSLLISHHGELVFEKYYNGTDPRRPANMKSASKSVISALIGIAIEQGYIDSVNEPIAQYFPEYISD
ncbi:MAG: serine hydrolase [Gammaproteobacteria bacterium]|nr:serine hydrolase [Gammaproteobacteria bacterium]MDP6732036.1 serine hydrolase [Gammaproteobacteria bacterium]